MSHVPRIVPDSYPTNVDAGTRSIPGAIAWVGILDKTGVPGLFAPEIRPGGQVFFGTLSTQDFTEVRFDGPSPFVEGRTQFRVLPGPAIPLTVRADAEGEFRFSFRDLNGEWDSRILVLDVSATGLSSRLQFLSDTTFGAITQSFIRSASREVAVRIHNGLEGRAIVSLGGPDRQPSEVPVESGQTHDESIRAPAFGKILTLQLGSVFEAQSGGTEQVDIILEPD